MTVCAAVLLLLQSETGNATASVAYTIEARTPIFRPGAKMELRVTIENVGDSETRLPEPSDYLEGLEVRSASGKVVKPTGRTRGLLRTRRAAEPGGFIGRTIDVSSALDVPPEAEGWHLLRWSFEDGTSNEVRVLVLRDWRATLETDQGDISIRFHPESAPRHVLNFLRLARSGFYDGSSFHRIIPGFMMQGGVPAIPAKAVGARLKAEFSDRKHVFGTVSMARGKEPDSATFQFFICFGRAAHLDRKYTVFAKVVRGEETLRKIEKLKREKSEAEVLIRKVILAAENPKSETRNPK